MRHVISAALLGAVLAGPALAGPVGDFNAAYDEAYGRYRVALFQTNSGQAEGSAKAMKAFSGAWAGLSATYGQTPPPQFSEDPQWAGTMAAVATAIEAASAQVAAGELAAAHDTLEHVRDVLGEMHTRNGVETFSDRMNAYHEAMEHVLMTDLKVLDADTVGQLREKAAVLSYLAGDILAHPPEGAAGNAEFDGLTQEFAASVAAVLDAARAGDPDAIRAAVGGLKKPYSKLFLKFG